MQQDTPTPGRQDLKHHLQFFTGAPLAMVFIGTTYMHMSRRVFCNTGPIIPYRIYVITMCVVVPLRLSPSTNNTTQDLFVLMLAVHA